MDRVVKIVVMFALGAAFGAFAAWPRALNVNSPRAMRPVVAFAGSTTYHVEGCRYGPMVEKFASEKEAREHGLKACPFCVTSTRLAGGE